MTSLSVLRRVDPLAAAVLTAAVLLVCGAPAEAQPDAEASLVAGIGGFVERYYAQAQAIVADEAVLIQTLNRDLSLDGPVRRLLYELRIEWNPEAPDEDDRAIVTRNLIEVNGRPADPGQEPQCLDPRGVSPEPLAFLLPDRRHRFTFTGLDEARIDDRPATTIEYRANAPEPPEIEWDEDCASISLPGRTRGRIWVDPDTHHVIRLDESVIGEVDIPVPWEHQRRGAPRYMTIERAVTSTRYRLVTFTDPGETLVLPDRIESMNVIRNSGSPRVRTTQTFDNYRRFVTRSRIVR